MWAELDEGTCVLWEIFWSILNLAFLYIRALCYKLASPLDALLLLYF